jgi:hypothetical protein
VTSIGVESLVPRDIADVRTQMEGLAIRLGGKYTGWEIARGTDGSVPDPSKPLF